MRTVSIRLNDNDYDMLSEAPIDPFYSESNMERLHHSFRQAEEGKLVVKTMEELEELAEDE